MPYFASQYQSLVMWPSDQTLERALSVLAWAQEAQVSERVQALQMLDVTQKTHWPKRLFPIIYCANMVHISPWASAEDSLKIWFTLKIQRHIGHVRPISI